MPVEIEKKFLLKSDEWRNLGSPVLYQQGYLLINKSKTIRIRKVGTIGYLTIKSTIKGISRLEFEYKIPIKDANILLQELCQKPTLRKYRTKITIADLVWEVDEFLDENKGLIIAEVELKSEDQNFHIPDWVGKEVTFDPKYFNSNLVRNPFTSWKTSKY